MPIQISGSGSISGISTGGLTDGCITIDEISTDATSGVGFGYVEGIGLNFIIFKSVEGSKYAVMWGSGTTSATDFVTVTFPFEFSSSPQVMVIDTNRTTFNTSIFATQIGNKTTSSFQVVCVQLISGTASNIARTFDWVAFGLVP